MHAQQKSKRAKGQVLTHSVKKSAGSIFSTGLRVAPAKGAHAFKDAASVPQNTCTAGSSFGVSGATGSTLALGRTSGAMRSSFVSSAAVVSRSAMSASWPTSSASSAT